MVDQFSSMTPSRELDVFLIPPPCRSLARLLTTVTCRLDTIHAVVERAFQDAGASESGLSYEKFKEAMKDSTPAMYIDIPVDA